MPAEIVTNIEQPAKPAEEIPPPQLHCLHGLIEQSPNGIARDELFELFRAQYPAGDLDPALFQLSWQLIREGISWLFENDAYRLVSLRTKGVVPPPDTIMQRKRAAGNLTEEAYQALRSEQFVAGIPSSTVKRMKKLLHPFGYGVDYQTIYRIIEGRSPLLRLLLGS